MHAANHTCGLYVGFASASTPHTAVHTLPSSPTLSTPFTPQAKWVADAVTHSLYHGLLEVKCVPFLASEPVSRYSLDLIPVSYVMHSPVITLKEKMKVGQGGRCGRCFDAVRRRSCGEGIHEVF